MNYLLSGLIFLIPLFFLSLSSEYYYTNKLFLIAAVAFLGILYLIFNLVRKKKISWTVMPAELPFLMFVISLALSTFISSVNKVQALSNISIGLVPMAVLFIFYLIASKNTKEITIDRAISVSGAIIAVITAVLFFKPFAAVNLPKMISFLKIPYFTPAGSVADLVVFFAFLLVLRLTRKSKMNTVDIAFIGVFAAGLIFSVIQFFQPSSVILPPFRLSWYAGLEALKTPLTAIFGFGVDNFSIAFNRVKDALYNQSALWQIGSFNVSRSIVLHVLTETGILGLLSLFFIFLAAFRTSFSGENKKNRFLVLFWLVAAFLFPPTFFIFFLFVLSLVIIEKDALAHFVKTELNPNLWMSVALAAVAFVAVAASSYFMGRYYAAEYYFKKSLDGLGANNAKQVYDNMRQARLLNPYNEKYVLNFSQTNLLIANNLTRKEKLTETDKQTIAKAIQIAISEGKELVRLNSLKSQNWENLAVIYRSVIPVAQGSDAWAISSYQRAIILDPQNPTFRLNLGGIYYLLGKYQDAAGFFQQAVGLKPDWANGYYNLAWMYYRSGEYEKAVLSMQNVVTLVAKTGSKEDQKKAQDELETFKKKLPAKTETTNNSNNLNLPEKPETVISPKLELPKEASPEAK